MKREKKKMDNSKDIQMLQEDCFLPESNNSYPLCIGRDLEKCKICSVWQEFPEPCDSM